MQQVIWKKRKEMTYWCLAKLVMMEFHSDYYLYIYLYILKCSGFFSAFWVEWFDFITNYVCDKSITSPVEAMSKFMKRAIIKIK